MSHLFEMSVTDRDDGIYTKSDLLVEPDGAPNHPQPESVLIDVQELRAGDGWMRATSPSGRVEYEGVIQWSPSARTGELPAERGQSPGVETSDAEDTVDG